METEIQAAGGLPCLRRSQSGTSRNSSIGRDLESNVEGSTQYTSLRDIIDSSPTKSSFCYEGNEFDSSNITIRNELVKRAASVYLQSAALLVSKNDNICFPAFWDKAKTSAASLCSWWRLSAVNPIRVCVSSVLRFFNNMFRNVRSLP